MTRKICTFTVYCFDGIRPDGMTLIPCGKGQTFDEPLTRSHLHIWKLQLDFLGAGDVAEQAEQAKCLKHSSLHWSTNTSSYHTVAIESSGVLGPKALSFSHNQGGRLISVSMEPQAHSYLYQRISSAIQRANTAVVTGTLSSDSDELMLFVGFLNHCFVSSCFSNFVFFILFAFFPFLPTCLSSSCFCLYVCPCFVFFIIIIIVFVSFCLPCILLCSFL